MNLARNNSLFMVCVIVPAIHLTTTGTITTHVRLAGRIAAGTEEPERGHRKHSLRVMALVVAISVASALLPQARVSANVACEIGATTDCAGPIRRDNRREGHGGGKSAVFPDDARQSPGTTQKLNIH